jgi:hypothetical protein
MLCACGGLKGKRKLCFTAGADCLGYHQNIAARSLKIQEKNENAECTEINQSDY